MAVHFPMPIGAPDWPLVSCLRAHWRDAQIVCGQIRMSGYRSRLALITFNWQLARFAFRSVFAATRDKSVDAILVSSDAELLGAALACRLRRRRLPITLLGFIYTERRSRLIGALREAAFRHLLARASCVICFSQLEEQRYQMRFRLARTRFVGIPYGLHVHPTLPPETPEHPYLLSAGRSGRDYALLARAACHTELRIKIVCDADAPLRGITFPANVEILRDCHGAAFFQLLNAAQAVVIPLAADDISAGQMVLLQAMALSKPTIITRTRTSQEYGRDGLNLLFVEPGSEQQLAQAIATLDQNRELRERIGHEARRHYLEHHSIGAFARNIAAAVDQHGRGR